MRVKFDLRPAGILEKERKQRGFNIIRLVAVLLLLLFIGSSVFYIASVSLSVFQMKVSIENVTDQISDLEAAQRALEMEVGRLKAQEKVYQETLKIMQDDLPVLEVLYTLEMHMPRGMGINTLKLVPSRAANTPNTATFDGTAASDAQIITFVGELEQSGAFSAVRLPSSKRDEKSGRVSFTLDLTLKPIGQIEIKTGISPETEGEES